MTATKKEAPGNKKGKGQEQGTSGTVPGLEVTAILDGFNRAGLAWSDKPTKVKLSDLTEEQIAEIKRCPGLIKKDVEMEDDQADDAANADDKAETTDNEPQGEAA